ncbi:cation-translocating P-type ATPase [Rhodoblastus acidophilus]|uniref:Cation-translocating P-type ATPase n=1 Tax=Candidatus Rhodoblastus alkanivorans TaxID=2954117 RepID=A0ABS9Z3Y5_9HYPH|nr:cation-translocating P-type ATPase [Candidatus Rhodoblastus alkanivorans]MCI4680588.1 cation-translocating P-type ATPase [Candidatus Rhodoblastus alkanivorans]MCI4681766.1 cation-translocating P-type ATPase [Candidatus Rhodoblastus alkanivorans]MDI4642815.1 cation-translocating P-type ATPase [Rhodoblastus acidophilus]
MSTDSASTSDSRGLTEEEATARLAAEGFNELPQADRRTPFRIVLDVLREPMLVLLIGGGVIYLALGDVKEAIVLLVFACLSVVITVVQETRTEKVLEALRDLTSPRALVIRDGERQRIAGREVVRGDLIVLAEGDRVPADVRLVVGEDLQADESLLTGESAAVRKIAAASGSKATPRPGGDDLPVAYSGTLIVRGSGIGEVIATGAASEIGKIGKSLGELETAAPHLQTETRKLVGIFAIFGGIVSVVVVVLYGTLRGSWLDALLAGIAVGMSMLPEEFPVVLAVFMAMGAWRISQARVLTRRAMAIEALGSATVLCTDKTGTLTENRMTIAELRLASGASQTVSAVGESLPSGFGDLVDLGALASAVEPFDPMEKAFHALAQRGITPAASKGALVRSYPLRSDFLAMAQVWRPAGATNDHVVAAKGAPEAIADLCRLGAGERAALAAAVDEMAASGLRVLGIARAAFKGTDFPETQRDFRFKFIGLAGLADPLRKSVPPAVALCRTAGIRVIMITGDYPATARAISRQAGIDSEDAITGEELERLDDAALAARVKTCSIFARIMPDQKLRVVKALKANNEIVAMTGDGVNDAPSLKAAHIGVAMGGRGTDVAREASSIVLLDDEFGSIVTTIRLGRRIYDNLRKAMSFIFAVHVPIAGLALLPLAFGMPILFGPMHIAFLEMIIDPVCSLVFEAEVEEDNLMRRPPRDPAEPLFSGAMILWSVFQGALTLSLVAAIYLVALQRGMPVDEVRALTFFSLVISIVALIFVNRSISASLFKALLRPNRVLAAVLPAVVAMLAATLLWPAARDLFRFGPLHADDLSLTFGAGLIVLIVLESFKWLWSRRDRNQRADQ